MKSLIPTLMLAGALAPLSPATAQTAEERDARKQAEQSRQQSESARRQSDAAREQAQAARAEAEAAKRQSENLRVEREVVIEQHVDAREAASRAMEKAQKEVQKAAEKAREATIKAGEKFDVKLIEVEVQRALAAAEAIMQKELFAQAKPVPPAVPGLPTPPTPPAPPNKFTPVRHPVSFTRKPTVRTLVVGSRPTDAKTQAALEEDLTVMWRILDKETERELGKDGAEKALGIFISSADSRSPAAVYLDGYGALFTLSVRFPLVAPPKAKEEEKSEPAPDTVWEKTKKELFGSPDGGSNDSKVKYFRSEYSKGEVEYDAAKVEALKNALLEGLKNANNLRQLKPDDTISVAVLGGGTGGGFGDTFFYKTDNSNKNRASYSVTTSGTATIAASGTFDTPDTDILMNKVTGGRSSTLTIKVMKSDVDSFASGKLSFDEFRKRASINIY